jgi:mannose-6-phosphate isomerase-like protein (cupin superfamily)
MQPQIKKQNLESEFFTEERCHITELSNDGADPELSIARVRVEPGVTTCWHRLKHNHERYVITAGEGRMEVGDLPPQQVGPGDVVLIPKCCPQRIANTSQENDLIFLAICTPAFEVNSYEDVEHLYKT